VFCVAVDGALLAKYFADDAVLRHVVDLEPGLPPSRKVLTLLDYIDKHVARVETTDESFLPGLSFLRPTARQVLEKGGDCADRSRLLVELLKREGGRPGSRSTTPLRTASSARYLASSAPSTVTPNTTATSTARRGRRDPWANRNLQPVTGSGCRTPPSASPQWTRCRAFRCPGAPA